MKSVSIVSPPGASARGMLSEQHAPVAFAPATTAASPSASPSPRQCVRLAKKRIVATPCDAARAMGSSSCVYRHTPAFERSAEAVARSEPSSKSRKASSGAPSMYVVRAPNASTAWSAVGEPSRRTMRTGGPWQSTAPETAGARPSASERDG